MPEEWMVALEIYETVGVGRGSVGLEPVFQAIDAARKKQMNAEHDWPELLRELADTVVQEREVVDKMTSLLFRWRAVRPGRLSTDELFQWNREVEELLSLLPPPSD